MAYRPQPIRQAVIPKEGKPGADASKPWGRDVALEVPDPTAD